MRDEQNRCSENCENKYNIDFDFIRNLEGGQILEAYVPAPETSNSGVTIATGVDLSGKDKNYLDKIGVSDGLIEKLFPYCGREKYCAFGYLTVHPLKISKEEADHLDEKVFIENLQRFTKLFNKACETKFHELNMYKQTVILSVQHQYGPYLKKRTPSFWSYITNERWKDVLRELRNFGDDYPTRRNKEADLLEKGM